MMAEIADKELFGYHSAIYKPFCLNLNLIIGKNWKWKYKYKLVPVIERFEPFSRQEDILQL